MGCSSDRFAPARDIGCTTNSNEFANPNKRFFHWTDGLPAAFTEIMHMPNQRRINAGGDELEIIGHPLKTGS